MPLSPLLTTKDLDDIGTAAFGAQDVRAVAAELVEAVEQGRLADQADSGYALMLAAEMTERAGDLDGALVLAERAVPAYQQDAGRDDGYARSFRAGLLLRLGRADEGLAELARLRRLLTREVEAVSYVSEALQAGGYPEIAEQWLTAALETMRLRDSMQSRADPAYRSAAMIVYGLTQQRYRIRRDLDLPHDEHDELADRMRDALDGVLADEDDDGEGDLAVLFWPRAQFEALLTRWPGLSQAYGSTWDEHRDAVEQGLRKGSQVGLSGLAVRSGRVEDLVRYAARLGGDAADADMREGYAHSVWARPWPPGRNEACWCGSGVKYKKCCLARARS